MSEIWGNIVRFFVENFPDATTLAIAGPPALVWSALCLYFAGVLKAQWQVKTGYTRKAFHFLIFFSVVVINRIWGTPGVCVFGGLTSLVIAYALLRGAGNIMYEAMAREKDAPRRSYFIIIPYFATLLGGLLSNILFPTTAVFGYLVTGLGDAVAEPVGTCFGKHEYRVPSIRGVRSTRSLEGSGAVFIASLLTLTVYFMLSPGLDLSRAVFLAIAMISLISTFVESITPHGWDNTTLQIVPAMLGAILLK
jgi:phytol kinase